MSLVVEVSFRVELSEDDIAGFEIETDVGEEADEEAIAESVRDLFSDNPAEFLDHYPLFGGVKAEVV